MIAPTSFFADYGCHVRILEETRVLQKMGHKVTIVAYRNGNDLPGLDIRRTLPIPWRTDYEVGSSRHKIGFDFLLGLKTLQLLAFNRYDVIHAHLHEGALIGLVLGKLFNIPVVFDLQGSLTEEMIDHNFLQRDSAIYKPLRRLEEWIVRASPAIFTSSAHAERMVIQKFRGRPERVNLLPDCVNTDVFQPKTDFDPDELAAFRQQLAIPPTAKVIVYLGLLTEYQGTGLLLEAMKRILEEHPNVHLLLMGFPTTYYEIKAEELGIRHAVTFTGRVPYGEAPRYLALGDVAAAPKLSLTEGSGKLLNYMAVALPTVAFDTPVAREYLGLHGVFAKIGDVDSLTQKLCSILFLQTEEDTEEDTLHDGSTIPIAWYGLGQRLRERARQRFEWSQAGHHIVETYRRLIGEPPSSPSENHSPKMAPEIMR